MRKLLIAASGLGGLWALNRLSATRDSTKWEISFLSTGFSQRCQGQMKIARVEIVRVGIARVGLLVKGLSMGLEDDGITLLPGNTNAINYQTTAVVKIQ
eukprot:351423-Amorphochlora_amoeboformis.AAC.1